MLLMMMAEDKTLNSTKTSMFSFTINNMMTDFTKLYVNWMFLIVMLLAVMLLAVMLVVMVLVVMVILKSKVIGIFYQYAI